MKQKQSKIKHKEGVVERKFNQINPIELSQWTKDFPSFDNENNVCSNLSERFYKDRP